MTFLPVVAREMIALSRRRSTYVWRTVTALFAMLVIGWLFLITISGASFAQLGKTIFIVLSSLSFAFALFIGIHSTSDAVSEEKREGTLGLLFLTDLKSYDIVLGKLAATSLSATYALAGLIPMIALAVLLGGVSLGDVARVAFVLANTIFFSLALGMFVSAISVNERQAMFTSCVVLFLLVFAPSIISFSLFSRGIEASIIWVSPLYPFLCLMAPSGKIPRFNSEYLYRSLILHHFLGWLLLLRAASLLPAFVHGTGRGKLDSLKERFDNYVFGTAAQRQTHRTALLDRNAFLWLAARERVKPVWAWGVLAVFFLLYLWVAFGFRGILFNFDTSVVILFLVHLILKFWVTSEVCNRLIQDRRGGALELLLTSPLSVRQIADGQQLALRHIFGKPVAALIVAEIILMITSPFVFNKPSPADRVLAYAVAITSLLLDLWALKWVGLWLSLFGKSIERVLIGTVLRVLAVPWLVFLGIFGVLAALSNFYGRPLEGREALLLWWVCGVAVALGFALPARRDFFRHFREIAANRYESPATLAKAGESRPASDSSRLSILWRVARRHPILNSAAALVFLSVLGVFLHRAYWEHQLQSRTLAIQSQQLPTRILEISKVHPAIPNRENAFEALREAGAVRLSAGRGPAWNMASATFLHGLDSANRASFEAMVTNNRSRLAAFHGLSRFTNAYIQPVIDHRYGANYHLFGFVHLACADLMLAFDERDPARMERDIEGVLHFVKLLRSQPLSYPRAIALHASATLLVTLEAVFFQNALGDETLRRLQSLAVSPDSSDALTRWLVINRALALDPPGPDPFAMTQPPSVSPARRRFMEAIGTRQQQLARALDLFEKAIALGAQPYYDRALWASGLSIWTGRKDGSSAALDQIQESEIREAIFIHGGGIARGRLLETAFAIQRYFRAHSAYPPTLEALVPEFLPNVPADPFSTGPLRWKLTSDGALLYSHGYNLQDDSGQSQGFISADFTFRFYHPGTP